MRKTQLTLALLALTITISLPGLAQSQKPVERRVAACPPPPTLTNSAAKPSVSLAGIALYSSLETLLQKYGAPAEGSLMERAKGIGHVEEFPDKATDFTVSRDIEWKIGGQTYKYPADFYYFCYGAEGRNALYRIEVHFIPNEMEGLVKGELTKLFGPCQAAEYAKGWEWPKKDAPLQVQGYVAYDPGDTTQEGTITLTGSWGLDESLRRLDEIDSTRRIKPARVEKKASD